MNQPPAYCPYCGASVTGIETSAAADVETPTVYRCDSCDDYVYYNPTPGGSAVVVDDDSPLLADVPLAPFEAQRASLLLVEDFRSPGEWKLPSGRIELGESAREGVARELEEETGLVVDPNDLVHFHDEAGEPVDEQYMVNIDYAVSRSETAGTLGAGSDATDARFFTPAEFAASEYALKHTHVDRFGTDSLPWILEEARRAIAVRLDP